jgi:sterol desaturase/sphingolipid hydroxylase (fatty acid hydroxylase superfamily)
VDLIRPGLSSGTILAFLFIAAGLWESSWPEWHSAIPAGRRWLVNLSLYALTIGGTIALWPVMARVQPDPILPAFPQTPFGAAAHLAAILLVLDLIYYLGHRAVHAVPGLWRFHAVHHTDLDLDVTTSVRHHPGEALLFGAGTGLAGALFGAAPGEVAVYGALAFGVQLVAHANLALPPRLESTLALFLVTPCFHRLHHSRDKRESETNFGQVFSFWDRMFGTVAASRARNPAAFGVTRYLDPRYQNLGWMLLQPALAVPHPEPPSKPPVAREGSA